MKKLAYIHFLVEGRDTTFEEVYTVLQPTIYYLPGEFVIKIVGVEANQISINIQNLFDKTIQETVVLYSQKKLIR